MLRRAGINVSHPHAGERRPPAEREDSRIVRRRQKPDRLFGQGESRIHLVRVSPCGWPISVSTETLPV